MKLFSVSAALMVAGLLVAAPAFAQQGQSKQKTDGDGLPMVGPGSKAYQQQTDGHGLAGIGPGSEASKQKTQSFSHADPASGLAKQN
jgi:hypothetical protein